MFYAAGTTKTTPVNMRDVVSAGKLLGAMYDGYAPIVFVAVFVKICPPPDALTALFTHVKELGCAFTRPEFADNVK